MSVSVCTIACDVAIVTALRIRRQIIQDGQRHTQAVQTLDIKRISLVSLHHSI